MPNPSRRSWTPHRKHWNEASPELQWGALLSEWKAVAASVEPMALLKASTPEPQWKRKDGSEAPVSLGARHLARLLADSKSTEDRAAVWIAATAKLLLERTAQQPAKMLSWMLFNLAEVNPAIQPWPISGLDRSTVPLAKPWLNLASPWQPNAVVGLAAKNAATTLSEFTLVIPTETQHEP